MTSSVTVTRHGHFAEVRFGEPPHNFASPALLARIADAVEELDADPIIRCTVLVAEGRSFCGGANLAGDDSMSGAAGMETIARLYMQAERLYRRRKPMIAAIQGAAVGAGLGLALVADFRVASPGARFVCNFARLGFHPGFGLTYTLPRLIGIQNASLMMLAAQRVKPDQALAWGLVDRLATDAGLIHAAHEMAADIAGNAPLALLAIRETIMESYAPNVVAAMKREHQQQSILKPTEDYAEGVASVFERRDADFRGR